MKRKSAVIFLLLCVALRNGSVMITDADVLNEKNRAEEETENGDIPDYIITQSAFLSYADMQNHESRSQVFSIWNTEDKDMTYFLSMNYPSETARCGITLEVCRRGDVFYRGSIPEEPLELAVLSPGEHVVMELTAEKTGDWQNEISWDGYPVFSKKENLSCDGK